MKETAKQKKMLRKVHILSRAEGCIDAFLGAVSFCVVGTLASLIILQCHWIAFLWSPQGLSPRFVLCIWGLPDPCLVCLSSLPALWMFLLTLSNTIIHRLMIFRSVNPVLFRAPYQYFSHIAAVHPYQILWAQIWNQYFFPRTHQDSFLSWGTAEIWVSSGSFLPHIQHISLSCQFFLRMFLKSGLSCLIPLQLP